MAPDDFAATLVADRAKREALMARVAEPTTVAYGPEELVQEIIKGTFIRTGALTRVSWLSGIGRKEWHKRLWPLSRIRIASSGRK